MGNPQFQSTLSIKEEGQKQEDEIEEKEEFTLATLLGDKKVKTKRKTQKMNTIDGFAKVTSAIMSQEGKIEYTA